MKSGMKYLIESFYRSITDGTPEPIPYREILLTTSIMEKIFDRLEKQQDDASSECGLTASIGTTI
jgi:hypothetical protein